VTAGWKSSSPLGGDKEMLLMSISFQLVVGSMDLLFGKPAVGIYPRKIYN